MRTTEGMTGGLFDLSGKTSLVTGASRGLGREVALALAAAGAEVFCAARSREGLEAAVESIREAGGEADFFAADVSIEEQVADLVSRAVSRFGRIDVLVHCAGVMKAGPSLSFEAADWRSVLDANLTGAFLVCRETGRVMRKSGGGRIVLIGSAFADRVLPYALAYIVSKAGVSALVRGLAFEWARYNIRVNGLALGYFDTEMPRAVLGDPVARESLLTRIPIRRVGRPEEIGPLCVFLASDAADYINGEMIRVDGGQSVHTS